MPVIKLVNEMNSVPYDSPDALYNLLHYVMDPTKDAMEKYRGCTDTLECAGCEPFPFPLELQTDPDTVFQYMMVNHSIYRDDIPDLARHRIISFHPASLILPGDLNVLGQMVVRIYRERGYIAAYALHRDTFAYHLHLVISSVSYVNGNKFHIFQEYNLLSDVIRQWEYEHGKKLDDPEIAAKYMDLLFGDSSVSYGKIALSAKEQLRLNGKR